MSIRTERVSSVIQEVLGKIFQKEMSLNANGLTTITRVLVTTDLSVAHIYLSVVGMDQDKVLTFVNLEKKRIRKELASEIRSQFKRVPEILFYLDKQLEFAQRIEQLLNSSKK